MLATVTNNLAQLAMPADTTDSQSHRAATSILITTTDSDSATAENATCILITVTDSDSATAENAKAATEEQDMLSQIIQGYASDPWFADTNNTADLERWHGLYCKDDALVTPDLPDLKVKILKELHDSTYAGRVAYYRTTHMVRRMYRWPPGLRWPKKSASVSKVVANANKTSQCRHILQAS